jgi:diaminopimelate decarboxylase
MRTFADPSPFVYRDGVLCAGTVSLEAIAAAVGTPCYVYDLNRVVTNLARLRGAFPTAAVHYSLKANANLGLVRALVEAGAGLDAVSGGEIFRAVQAGAGPSTIVFAGVGKTMAELDYALSLGVGWINVESADEYERLAHLARTRGIRPRVALRLNPDIHADTHHHIDTGHAAAKFGIAIAEARAILDRYAANADTSPLIVAGLHVHIGSQIGNPARLAEAAETALALFDSYPFLDTLNLGGGLPVPYDAPVPPIDAFASALASVLRPAADGRIPHLLLEPGRYITADAGALIVEVQAIKQGTDGRLVAVTDGGMTELIRPALYGARHPVVPVRERASVAPVPFAIVGPVCESADVLREAALLPPLRVGDRLAVLVTGAYAASMGSTYNARPRPPEVLVTGDGWRVARRRETWEDLIALECPHDTPDG